MNELERIREILKELKRTRAIFKADHRNRVTYDMALTMFSLYAESALDKLLAVADAAAEYLVYEPVSAISGYGVYECDYCGECATDSDEIVHPPVCEYAILVNALAALTSEKVSAGENHAGGKGENHNG